MVLDTNVKKFKYSTVKKLLCVLVCAITFFFALKIGTTTVFTAVYLQDEYYTSQNAQSTVLSDWTASRSFYHAFRNDISSIKDLVSYEADIAETNQKLLLAKQGYIESALKEVEKLKAAATETAKQQQAQQYYDGEDEDITEPVEEVTYYNSDYLNSSASVRITINNRTVGYFDVFINDNEQTLSKRFDEHANEWVSEYYYGFTNTGIHKPSNELHYFVKLGENENSNLKSFDEKKAYAAEIYFIVKNGALEYKGINENVAKDIFENISSFSSVSDTTLYAYLNTSELTNTGFEALIDAGVRNEDITYSQLYETHNQAIKSGGKVARNAIITLILLIVSFAFGFEYFGISGKSDEESDAKLRIYDYIPFEIGLAAVGGIITAIFFAVVEIVEGLPSSEISMASVYTIIIMGMLSWVCLFILCASTARYFHSGRKFYKHFIAYWLLLACWKIIKFCGKALKAIFLAFFAALKKIFGGISSISKRAASGFYYKPKKFKRNVIALVLLWFFADLLLAGFFALSVANYAPVSAILFALLFAVGNGYVLYRVCLYVKNLDMIIDASSKHEDIAVDLNSLDLSLKTLAEGMRYTNAELQTAINKAVKDERLRTELITNVSHDLKTPLTSIIVYVDLLSKCDIDDEKAQEYIAVLDEKGKKLKKLIDDLIEASKVTSGNVTITPTNINLSELCLQATVEAQTDFEKAGLDLVVKSGERQTIVYADGTKTNRIIENLLSNARKYSAKASRVYVSVYEEDGQGIFEIKNISAQPLDITPEELTERFVRGDKSRNKEGNGLGLSIAKELCSLQHGELELQIDGDLFKARVKLPKPKM